MTAIATNWRRIELWLTLCAAAVTTVFAALAVDAAWAFTTDDAYITLRYARMLASGQGLRFNSGELPVEGYSNFVSVLLGAAALALSFDPVFVLKASGVSGLIGCAVLSYRLGRRWLPPLPAILVPFWTTAYYGSVWWSVSGLETGLYQFSALACVLLTFSGLGYAPLGEAHGRVSISKLAVAGALIALASLIRPEAPVLGIALGSMMLSHFWAVLRRGSRGERAVAHRNMGAFALCFALPYAAYFAFRLSYFGRLLPNPVYCKAAYEGSSWLLLKDAFQAFWPLLALALLQPWWRPDRPWLVLFGLPLLYAFLLYGVDPIIGYHARHFLAVLPFIATAAAAGLWNVARLMGAQRELLRGAVVVAVGVLAGPRFEIDALREEALFYARRMRVREELAEYIDARVSPNDWVLLGDSGVIPYRSHAKYVDAYCLNSRETTLPPISFEPQRFVEWALQKDPELIVVSSWGDTRLRPATEHGVWPVLVKTPAFTTRYTLLKKVPMERFMTYWVYRRRGA